MAPFSFAVRTKESNTCASFRMNAWKCAQWATDRDLKSSSNMKRVNAWIRAPPTTDRDLDNAIFNVFLTTDHDPASVIPDKKR